MGINLKLTCIIADNKVISVKIINNSLEHSYETEKGKLIWWESNPMPLICRTSALDC